MRAGWDAKRRWRRPQGSRDSHPGLYDVAPLGAFEWCETAERIGSHVGNLTFNAIVAIERTLAIAVLLKSSE